MLDQARRQGRKTWDYTLTPLLGYRLRCTFRRVEIDRKRHSEAGDSLKRLRIERKSPLPVSRGEATEQHHCRTFGSSTDRTKFRLEYVQQPTQLLYERQAVT